MWLVSCGSTPMIVLVVLGLRRMGHGGRHADFETPGGNHASAEPDRSRHTDRSGTSSSDATSPKRFVSSLATTGSNQVRPAQRRLTRFDSEPAEPVPTSASLARRLLGPVGRGCTPGTRAVIGFCAVPILRRPRVV